MTTTASASLRHLLGLVILLSATSFSWAAAPFPQSAPTETWSYTNCVNADGVPAHADTSNLWIRRSGKNAIEATWQTTLLQGYDEMYPTDSAGAMIPNSKPTSASHPVSATWKLILKADFSIVHPLSFSYSSSAYALVESEFDVLPGLVRYFDSSHAPSRKLVLAQAISKNEYWVSLYTPTSMARAQFTTDESGKITGSAIARTCGDGAADLFKKVDMVRVLRDTPSGFGDIEPTSNQQ